jgi:hypothetical protein
MTTLCPQPVQHCSGSDLSSTSFSSRSSSSTEKHKAALGYPVRRWCTSRSGTNQGRKRCHLGRPKLLPGVALLFTESCTPAPTVNRGCLHERQCTYWLASLLPDATSRWTDPPQQAALRSPTCRCNPPRSLIHSPREQHEITCSISYGFRSVCASFIPYPSGDLIMFIFVCSVNNLCVLE